MSCKRKFQELSCYFELDLRHTNFLNQNDKRTLHALSKLGAQSENTQRAHLEHSQE